MGIDFILLASRATFNILPDELDKAWPPEFGGNKLMGLKVAGMTCGEMIMGTCYNELAKI
jgi:hypothetical protein